MIHALRALQVIRDRRLIFLSAARRSSARSVYAKIGCVVRRRVAQLFAKIVVYLIQ